MIKRLILIFILSFIIKGFSQSNVKSTYVTICFDVEDYITPESEKIDDIPKWLADIMTEVGIKGTFFVIGEKARALEKRGRYDVIESMSKHEIGSHTNLGSIHPTVTEILENAGWDDGIKKMIENESKGFKDLERIFGKEAKAFARHGGSYGPQLVAALAKMNKVYVYSPVHLPGHNITWFCNSLNFYGYYAGFDDTYYRDDYFQVKFDTLKANFSRFIKDVDAVNFFGCHPTKVRAKQYWDFNYYKGSNPDPSQWKIPELRPLDSMKTAKKNFKKLMQYLKRRKDIKLVTFAELIDKFSYQKDVIDQNELNKIAEDIIQQRKILITDYFSPAEIFAALSSSLTHFARYKTLPHQVKRDNPFGPTRMPNREPEVKLITKEQVLQLAEQASDFISKNETLPPWLFINDKRIGTGSLLELFSEIYNDIQNNKLKTTYKVKAFEPYPHENSEEIIKTIQEFKYWPVHKENLDMSSIIELTKMQLWTLKPAMEMEL